jgi:hypothetical protein
VALWSLTFAFDVGRSGLRSQCFGGVGWSLTAKKQINQELRKNLHTANVILSGIGFARKREVAILQSFNSNCVRAGENAH